MNNNCPICGGQLQSAPGTSIDPTDGVTVWCPAPFGVCGMDSAGHGKNEKDALEVFVQKCGKGAK